MIGKGISLSVLIVHLAVKCYSYCEILQRVIPVYETTSTKTGLHDNQLVAEAAHWPRALIDGIRDCSKHSFICTWVITINATVGFDH